MSHTNSLLFLAVALSFAGCGYKNYKNGAPGAAGVTPATQTVTFQQVESQVLTPKCASCHSGGTAPDLTSYSGFAQGTTYVVPGDPANSLLYQVVQSGAMPKTGAPLTTDQLSLVYSWIEQGALDN